MGYGQPQQQGGYPPQGNVPGISPETQRLFSMVDRDQSGKITSTELKSALINGKGEQFSDTACKLMIGKNRKRIQNNLFGHNNCFPNLKGMFNRDHSGTVDIHEFDKLYAYINQWLAVFKSFDRDASGHIDESELTQGMKL